ncbi:hypothetical protein AKJ16_DCAP11767, partial [Drosera capensis]
MGSGFDLVVAGKVGVVRRSRCRQLLGLMTAVVAGSMQGQSPSGGWANASGWMLPLPISPRRGFHTPPPALIPNVGLDRFGEVECLKMEELKEGVVGWEGTIQTATTQIKTSMLITLNPIPLATITPVTSRLPGSSLGKSGWGPQKAVEVSGTKLGCLSTVDHVSDADERSACHRVRQELTHRRI